jgi:hypothetical protein
MRTWLHSLQSSLDRAKEAGLYPAEELSKLASDSLSLNYTLTDDFFLARRLLCSKGHIYNCTQRSDIKLIDSDDIVNPEGNKRNHTY